MSKAHQYPLIIREHHLDTFGHVNNATYLEIFEEARWEIITNNGYGIAEIQKSGKAPTIMEIHLNFKHELRLRQSVIVHTELLSYEGKVGRMKQWITDSKGEVCCDMQMVFGLFDLNTRKLIVPTPEWLKALGN